MWDRRGFVHLLTLASRVLEKLTGFQLLDNSSHFMEPKVSLPHWKQPATCPYRDTDRLILCPYLTFWSSLIMLPFRLRLDLSGGLFFSGFPRKTLFTPFLSPTHATCPAHTIPFYLTPWIIFGEEYRSPSFSLCNFLHSPVTLSLLGPNIFHSTVFSNTLCMRFSPIVSNHISHPYTTTNKIILLYTLCVCRQRQQ